MLNALYIITLCRGF